MDASATNYNPDAQVDDGTCEYIIQVSTATPRNPRIECSQLPLGSQVSNTQGCAWAAGPSTASCGVRQHLCCRPAQMVMMHPLKFICDAAATACHVSLCPADLASSRVDSNAAAPWHLFYSHPDFVILCQFWATSAASKAHRSAPSSYISTALGSVFGSNFSS